LNRVLQLGETLVAQFDGKAHDRCGTRMGRPGKIGNCSESDQLRGRKHNLSDPAFGQSQRIRSIE
jgi:hypothetical protein